PDFVLGIFERSGGMLVGGTGLHRLAAETGQAEIGYWMRADRQGRGYATEACGGLISSALTPQIEGGWGFRRMTILCSTENGASAAVPRKLGIPLEQRIRLDRWIDGVGFTGTLGFGVLCDEWDFARQRAQPGAMARSLDR
ncbi:MAG: GNAT family N-acetyltransferase, partial [Phycisphaerales bacterium JB037]